MIHQQDSRNLPGSHTLITLLTCRLRPHIYDMCPEICSIPCLSNPDCSTQPTMRRYKLITNIYKSAECTSLAQCVSVDSATSSAQTEHKVLPRCQERSWSQVGRQPWDGCRDRTLRDTAATFAGLELLHEEPGARWVVPALKLTLVSRWDKPLW